ncbi:MAG: SpoIIE family protein phosphatase, partial [Brevinematales bacterium]
MKKLFKFIFSFIVKSYSNKIPVYAKADYDSEINFQNHTRIKYFSPLLILFLVPIIIFSDISDLHNPDKSRYFHDLLNTLCDLSFLFFSIFAAIVNIAVSPDKPQNIRKIHIFVNYLYAFFILLICSLNSVVDQLTSGSFIVYLLGLLGTGILMNMSLVKAITIYSAPHIIFILGVIFLQKNSATIASNIANSTVALAIGLFICVTFYNNKLRDLSGNFIIENQNKELKLKSESLENITSELQTKNIELELDHRQLNIKNNQTEKELEMAKRIQLQMIPKLPPLGQIAVYYRPMEQLGGDFYDFVPLPDKNRKGIFISDISGHGAPAAMMTSMIKSFILQSGEWSGHPSMFLSQLNLLLMDLCTELFITALYGVYDFSKRTFTYANAGHNLPYIISGNRIENLPAENKTIP